MYLYIYMDGLLPISRLYGWVRNIINLWSLDKIFNIGLDPHSLCLLAHWSLPSQSTLKLNVDGSFLEGYGWCRWCCSQQRWRLDRWSTFLTLKLEVMRCWVSCVLSSRVLFFVATKAIASLFESGCLEGVEVFAAGCDHTLHTYATAILHIWDLRYFTWKWKHCIEACS